MFPLVDESHKGSIVKAPSHKGSIVAGSQSQGEHRRWFPTVEDALR